MDPIRSLMTPSGAPAIIHDDGETLAEALAGALTAAIARRLSEAPFFTLALTGGRTPAPLYRRLNEPHWRQAVDWRRVKIFFGDERTVGPDHPDSNFGMAWEAWLRDGPIPRENIHRMDGEAADPAAAARYEATLRREVPAGPSGFPALDLALLGMGEDGHVASLFPGTRALWETRAAVVVNPVPQLNTTRLTLTFPALNAAREIWMLVTGAAKAERVAQALGWLPGGEHLPAARVRPAGGRVVWWLDRAAAERIPRRQEGAASMEKHSSPVVWTSSFR